MTFLVDRTILRTKSEMSHIVGGHSEAEKKITSQNSQNSAIVGIIPCDAERITIGIYSVSAFQRYFIPFAKFF